MAQKTLKWGLLSTAHINRVLIPVLRSSKRNELVAVSSRDLLRARAYAAEWRIPKAFGSYQEMLDDPSLDVIYISLPNSMHAEWAIRALQAGKHVLCEKPMALTSTDFKRMSAAAKRAGRVLAEAFMYLHSPQTLRVQELVASGALGKLQLVKGAFSFTVKQSGNIRLLAETGGGSIWDVGCYPISYARLLAGEEPVEVFAWQRKAKSGVDELFVGQLRFPNGIIAQFDSGLMSARRQYVELGGSDASLEIPVPFKPENRAEIILRRESGREVIRIQSGVLYSGEIEDMADAVLLGKPSRVSLQFSEGNLRTIRALLKSAQSGKPVTL